MASPRGQKEADRADALGALVRKLRRKHGDTLDELAKRIPMSPSNLSRLELGKQGPPSDEAIERIAAALDADPAELLRAAGRAAGGPSFEEQIIARLDALDRSLQEVGRDVREVKQAVSEQPSER